MFFTKFVKVTTKTNAPFGALFVWRYNETATRKND